MNPVMRFIHNMGSAQYFYRFTGHFIPWLAVASAALFAWGLYAGLVLAPPDYQQGDSYRILFVHVPSAWMSLFIYVAMGVMAIISLIWRIKVTEVCLVVSAPIGAAFTAVTLATGALWGKPMWGAYWVWDARLTSELVLLFLYVGVIALAGAIDDRRAAARAAAILTLVGLVNIPIIHYSVEWWNTLHQGQTVRFIGESSIDGSMLTPLLVMALACKLYYGLLLIIRARATLLEHDRRKKWVTELVQ